MYRVIRFVQMLVVSCAAALALASCDSSVPLDDLDLDDEVVVGGDATIDGDDEASMRVDPLEAVCRVCETDADCGEGGICVELFDGRFCGADCSESPDVCGRFFDCVDIVGSDGEDEVVVGQQCLPADDWCETCPDGDEDGVCDEDDACAGADDTEDEDEDGVPDACDACEGDDDTLDEDEDGVPDACDCDLIELECGSYGTCITSPDGVLCECKVGFVDEGEGCVDIDECTGDDLCHENADCTNTDGWYFCVCNPGYEGDGVSCAQIDGCADDPCYDGVVCTDEAPPLEGFECGACPAGLEGDGAVCTDINGCAENPCFAGVACTDVAAPDTGFTCGACPTGYDGDGVVCNNVDECADGTLNNCDPNAVCEDLPGLYACECKPGWNDVSSSGDGTACDDVNECALGTDNCSDNAACTNESGGFSCLCNTGWDGDGVICNNVDECADDGLNDCSDDAFCDDLEGSFICKCKPGYEGNGVTCNNIDECLTNNGGCDTLAGCYDDVPGFHCGDCPNGYANVNGNGTLCLDVNECAEGIDDCDPLAGCFNDEPGYDCGSCPAGYTDTFGDGTQCDNIDECDEDLDNCDDNATCTDTAGSFDCECNTGFLGDGVSCTDIDECALSLDDCDVNATCTNTPGSWECVCDDGWEEQGTACVDIDECAEDLDNCDTLTACVNTVPGYYCTECPRPYDDVFGDGTLCEICSDTFALTLETPDDPEACNVIELDARTDLLNDVQINVESVVAALSEHLEFLDASTLIELVEPLLGFGKDCREGDPDCMSGIPWDDIGPLLNEYINMAVPTVFDPDFIDADDSSDCVVVLDLPESLFCDDGSCTTNDDCESGYECGFDGFCGVIRECSWGQIGDEIILGGGLDCPRGYTCVPVADGIPPTCVLNDFCIDDVDCADGYYCDDGSKTTIGAICANDCTINADCPSGWLCGEGNECVEDCFTDRYDIDVAIFRPSDGDVYAELLFGGDTTGTGEMEYANPIDLRAYGDQFSIVADLPELLHALQIAETVEANAGLEFNLGLPESVEGVVEIDIAEQLPMVGDSAWQLAFNLRKAVTFTVDPDETVEGDTVEVSLAPSCPVLAIELDSNADRLGGQFTFSTWLSQTFLRGSTGLLGGQEVDDDWDHVICPEPIQEGGDCTDDEGNQRGCCCFDAEGATVECPIFDANLNPLDPDTLTPLGADECPWDSNGDSQYACLPEVGRAEIALGGLTFDIVLPVTGGDNEVLFLENVGLGAGVTGLSRNCEDATVIQPFCDNDLTAFVPVADVDLADAFSLVLSLPDGRDGVVIELLESIELNLDAMLVNFPDRSPNAPVELLDDLIRVAFTGESPELPLDLIFRLYDTRAPVELAAGALALNWDWTSGDEFDGDLFAPEGSCIYNGFMACESEDECPVGQTCNLEIGECELPIGSPDPHVFSLLYSNDCPTIIPFSADATVDASDILANYGDQEVVRVGGQYGFDDRYRTLFQFDDTELPTGAQSVFLELYAQDSLGELPGEFQIWAMPDPWTETEVNWTDVSELPPGDSSPLESLALPDEPGWVRIDLTNVFESWQAEVDPVTNNGLILIYEGYGTTTSEFERFHSRESSEGSRQPRVIAVPPRP